MADIFSDIGNWWNTLFQPQTTQANPFAGGKVTGSAGSVVPYTPAVAPAPPTTPTGASGYRATSPYNPPNEPWTSENWNPFLPYPSPPITYPTTSTTPSAQDNPRTYDDGTYTYMYDEYGGPGGLPQWKIVGPSQTSINEQNRIAKEEADRKFNEDARQWGLEYALSQQNVAAQQQQTANTQQYQRDQLAAEQAWRTQQIEVDKQQRLATLAAQPKSWLEYAALANQPPVVQPWMLPLMPQDYMKVDVGAPIPGWTTENMKGMPDLINPSAQFLARLSPDQRAQYYGYQQADTGQTPEDTQWRLWSQGPAGGNVSLRQTR